MYKRYNSQNEINFKSLHQGFKEEEFQNSFSFVFDKKECIDDIKFENKIYFNNRKVCDSTKNTTNEIGKKDYVSNRINSKINRIKLLALKKDNHISNKDKGKNIAYINTYNENYSSYINKVNEQSHLISEGKESTKIVENKNDLIIPLNIEIKYILEVLIKRKIKIYKK